MTLDGLPSNKIPILPTFLIVGAAKSGTTSLYHYLSQHPDIYMPPNKEPHWFSRLPYVPDRGSHPVNSEEEYLELFKGRDRESAIGEASPSYLWDEKAPYRIKEAIPQAKIIAILRHPVERAYSHYMMDVRMDKQDLPFMEALKRDYHAEKRGWGVSDQYIDLGFYAEQLQRYLKVFDRTQIKVFLYDDLRENPKALLRSALEFLDVDPKYTDTIRTDVQYNKFSLPKNRLAKMVLGSRFFKSQQFRALRVKLISNHQLRAWLRETVLFKEEIKHEMDSDSRRFLEDLYRTDIQRLQDLLNRDLSHWLHEVEN